MRRALGLWVAGLLALPGPAAGSDVELPGHEGHPRERFPLMVFVAPIGERPLEAAVKRAIDDWNAVSRTALGREAFVLAKGEAAAQVTIAVTPPQAQQAMGETELAFGPDGVIEPPVRIRLAEPSARGQTSRETLLYEVTAHELGHALGLPHATDPRSVMCCVSHALDFSNPAVRSAYIEGRRHPDLRSVETQLKEHYARFWR